MNNSVTDIISQIEAVNQQTGVDVYVPSLKRYVKFRPLNLKQQKDLLKSSVEETLTRLSFITSFYTIIQENILETIDINSLYVFDRIAIAIALRSTSLDSSYTINDITVNLQDKLSEIPLIVIDNEKITNIATVDGISVTLEVPRLGVDKDVCNSILNKIRTSQKEDVRTLIGDLFINEIIKYVKTITVGSGETESTTVLSNLKIENRLSIVEKFPTTLTKQILDFIKTYRSFEEGFTKTGDLNLEIDGSFFAI